MRLFPDCRIISLQCKEAVTIEPVGADKDGYWKVLIKI
jgi:hypothetical protein